MKLSSWSRWGVAGFVAAGLATVGGTGLALASGGPTSSQLKAIGSSSKAARTEPGLGSTRGSLPAGQPLIAIAFGGHGITVGGSAVGRTPTSVPVTQCSVNFTQRKTRAANGRSVSVRWFGGIGCSRRMTLFGEAFLAQSASKFDAKGNFYTGLLSAASSGRSGTVVAGANPSLYIWHAMNIYFPGRPPRGVLTIVPRTGQTLNGASSCQAVRSAKYGTGVHCDLYTNRF